MAAQRSEEKRFIVGKHMHEGLVVVRRHTATVLSDIAGIVAGLPMTAQGCCLNELKGAAAIHCSYRQTAAAILCLRHVSHDVSCIEHCDTYEEKSTFAENADTTSFAALCLRGKGANIKRSGAHNSLDASEKKGAKRPHYFAAGILSPSGVYRARWEAYSRARANKNDLF
ncbi:MAG: hypothetical protein ACXWL9_07180 [Syntrophales bacterium]